MGEVADSDVQESGECDCLVPIGIEASEFPVVDSGFFGVTSDVNFGAVMPAAVESAGDVPGNELAGSPQFTFLVVRLCKRLRRGNSEQDVATPFVFAL